MCVLKLVFFRITLAKFCNKSMLHALFPLNFSWIILYIFAREYAAVAHLFLLYHIEYCIILIQPIL